MSLVFHIYIGLAAAAIVTGWQGFKDTPWEGFSLRKFTRSYVVAVVFALILYVLQRQGVLVIGNYGVALLVILFVERLVGEFYKGFIRKPQHAAYAELFKRLGLHVASPGERATTGALVLVLLAAVVTWLLTTLVTQLVLWPGLLSSLLLGLLGGLLVAGAGAIKHSQREGFDQLKFVRSPLAGMAAGVVLIHFASQPLILVLAAIGLERITIEFYRTFIGRSVRGAFQGRKPRYSFWRQHRWWFFVLYLAGVCALVYSLLAT